MSSEDGIALGALGGAIFLGVVQGLTEFLPVSSSGHLVLFQQFLEIGGDHVLFDLVLHLGTLIPVLWFYREDVMVLLRDPLVGEGAFLERQGVKLWMLLIAASIPTAIIGLALEDVFEALFATPAALTVTFALTGLLLWSTRNREDGEISLSGMTIPLALALGLAQGFAITPGISRSGTTIAVALALGLSRDFAARFSFLMSVPAIGGAVLLKFRDVDGAELDAVPLLAGGLAAMVVGYGALTALVYVVKVGKLDRFSWYMWFIALVAGAIAWFA